MTNIFVLCSGQEDNIGDVVLRRKLLSELRHFGQLHVFLDDASTDFRQALNLDGGDVVYSDRAVWRSNLWISIRRREAWLVDKPGELIMSRRRLLALVRLTVAALMIRFQGGMVLRLGLGQRAPHRMFALLYRPLLASANVVAWRDPESMASFGIGRVMPDWGFGEVGLVTPGPRTRLAISYRSDRPELSDAALDGIASAAEMLGLVPVVVTQVGRDSVRSKSLASRLDCELVDWPDGRSHWEQEILLREIYAESAVVMSDRLHVLIVAMTEGAVPLGLTEHAESKIQRHFDAVELADVSVRVASGDADSTRAAIGQAATRGAEVQSRLAMASDRIDSLCGDLQDKSKRLTASRDHG